MAPANANMSRLFVQHVIGNTLAKGHNGHSLTDGCSTCLCEWMPNGVMCVVVGAV